MYEDKKLEILVEILGNYNRTGSEYLFTCPKCNHHKKKLSVNIDKDKYKCWICEWSGSTIFRLVKRLGNYHHQRFWSEFSGIVEISEYEKIFNSTETINVEEERVELPNEFLSLCNRDMSLTALSAKRYLKERGITKEDILFWKIGYCVNGEYSGRVVFPSFSLSGHCNYFVGRSYEQNPFRKYMNPNASKDVVFNELYIDWSSDVTIVEGVFDAVKATNAIPILGSTVKEDSKLFKSIVNNDPAIYIALDPDAEKKAEKLINNLLSYDVEVYKVPIPNNKDVGDMTKEEFQECKKQATLIKNTDYMLYRKIMGI